MPFNHVYIALLKLFLVFFKHSKSGRVEVHLQEIKYQTIGTYFSRKKHRLLFT